MQQTKPSDTIPRIFDEPQQRQHVLDVGSVKELQPAEFYGRNAPARQLDFERTAVTGCPEQNGLLLEERAGLTILQDAFDDEACLVGFVTHRDKLRLRCGSPFGPKVLGEALLGVTDDAV